MLVIKTKEYDFPQQKYFKILMASYIRKRWWVWALLVIMSIVFLGIGQSWEVKLFICTFSAVYPLFLWWVYRRHAYSPKNAHLLQKRTVIISDQFIQTVMEDGTEGKYNWSHVVNALKRDGYYLLYVSRIQFIYLPFEVFEEGDTEKLEAHLREKRLLKP